MTNILQKLFSRTNKNIVSENQNIRGHEFEILNNFDSAKANLSKRYSHSVPVEGQEKEDYEVSSIQIKISFLNEAINAVLSDTKSNINTERYSILKQHIDNAINNNPDYLVCPLGPIDESFVHYLSEAKHNRLINQQQMLSNEYVNGSKFSDQAFINEMNDIQLNNWSSQSDNYTREQTDNGLKLYLEAKPFTKDKKYEESLQVLLAAWKLGYQEHDTWLRGAINARYMKNRQLEEAILLKAISWAKKSGVPITDYNNRLNRVHELMQKHSN